MRVLLVSLLGLISACGAAPAPAPARSVDLADDATTVAQWQAATAQERQAAAVEVIGVLYETARPDQRQRIARDVNRCLDDKLLELKPSDSIYTTRYANFYSCLSDLGYK